MYFAKVIIIKTAQNVFMNQFGHVAAYLSSPYWCVYGAQCRVRLLLMCVHCTVRLLLVCVQCTVQSETGIGACTVHSAE